MLDRNYFEKVLVDQLRLMERSSRLTVYLETGDEFDVHALVAAHDSYVILRIYSKGREPEHSKRWQAENPDADATIYDQVALPYSRIRATRLTAQKPPKEGERPKSIGFHQGPPAL